MPNVWTHIYFGEDVAEKSGYSVPSEDVKPYFRLGAQGPDPFFYHNFWPWKKEKPVAGIGGKIHRESCGPFLMEMIQYGAEHSSDLYLQAYILGFLTHHILDRNAHPYIIYCSGNKDHKHQRLEVIIDTLLMKELKGLKTWKTPVYEQINVGKHLYAPVRDMLRVLIERFFPEDAALMPSNYIDDSYRDMIKALKALFDPLGWKNKAFEKQVSAFSYQKVEDDNDYLNRERRNWYHPADDHEEHNESFDDLLKNAEQEGIRILTAVLDYWNNGQEHSCEGIQKELKNLAYDTGKDCTLPLKIRYFDPIL
ncbi:MAG TPA: zinc dependent phospholipase C family protein [Bacillales bacterium]|nr:zinc dependent phospholipase C family protein [Bacillales bacterium]